MASHPSSSSGAFRSSHSSPSLELDDFELDSFSFSKRESLDILHGLRGEVQELGVSDHQHKLEKSARRGGYGGAHSSSSGSASARVPVRTPSSPAPQHGGAPNNAHQHHSSRSPNNQHVPHRDDHHHHHHHHHQQQQPSAPKSRPATAPTTTTNNTHNKRNNNSAAAQTTRLDTTQELYAECYASMRAKERQSYERYGINLAGCHVRVRAAFVEWVLDVCEELQLTLSTASTAVLYADRVLGNVKVPSKSLLLVGACCVLVAAKFEEPESKVPTLKKLHETIIDIYSEELMRKMELAILTELKWDLASVTPAHFVDYFLTSNRHGALDNLPRDACTDTARRYAMVFLSLSLQHIEFTVMFLPSVVAAAVVAAMRSKLGASRWTPSLAAATGYEEADISACCERVLAVYSRTFHTSDESEAMDVEPSSASERADAEAVRNGVALLHIDAAASLRHKEREPSAPSPKGPFEAWGSDGRLVGGA